MLKLYVLGSKKESGEVLFLLLLVSYTTDPPSIIMGEESTLSYSSFTKWRSENHESSLTMLCAVFII